MREAEATVTASIGEPNGRLWVSSPADFGDTILVLVRLLRPRALTRLMRGQGSDNP